MEPKVAEDLCSMDAINLGISGPLSAMLDTAGRRVTISMDSDGYVVEAHSGSDAAGVGKSPILPLALYAAFVRSNWL